MTRPTVSRDVQKRIETDLQAELEARGTDAVVRCTGVRTDGRVWFEVEICAGQGRDVPSEENPVGDITVGDVYTDFDNEVSVPFDEVDADGCDSTHIIQMADMVEQRYMDAIATERRGGPVGSDVWT